MSLSKFQNLGKRHGGDLSTRSCLYISRRISSVGSKKLRRPDFTGCEAFSVFETDIEESSGICEPMIVDSSVLSDGL